jgi:GT2 family glycosyltransferase
MIGSISDAAHLTERPSPSAAPRVGIIVLNWNGLDDTRACLASIREQTYKNVDVVVVDNASEHGEARQIQIEFPEVHVLPQAVNLGFGRAVNVGVRWLMAHDVPYVLLFNNDAWFDPHERTIEHLLDALHRDPKAGGAGPVILNAMAPHTIQSAGHLFSLYTAFPHRLLSEAPRNTKIEITKPGYIVGACLLMRTDVLRQIRGFDPDYFVYGEDIDLALRMRALGYHQILVPSTAIYHKKSVATTMWSEDHTYLMLRSHLILLKKHVRWYHLPSVLPSIIVITIGLSVLGIKNGHPLAAKGALRAWFDFLSGKWGGIQGELLEVTQEAWLAEAS